MQTVSFTFGRYLSSSTGKKFLMALSGAVLFGFIVGHLAGNLQIFKGQEAVNRYAVFLRSLGELLLITRVALISMLVIHLWTSVSLTYENAVARPVGYVEKDYIKASLASRTMIWSGLMILAFVIYHLLHFTFILVHPEYGHLIDAKGRHDVYSMGVLSFRQPAISIAYLVSLFLLCFHLSHGIQSMFQSMGFTSEALRSRLSVWGRWTALLIFAGYASIPLAVLMGIVKLPPGASVP